MVGAASILGGPNEVWARLSTRATSFENGNTLSITLAGWAPQRRFRDRGAAHT
ncbi:hypothetical protein [Pseudonocardia alaniniphila]|uniref:Uncharacterized protein n=1 Tax=Pseudonocardia alaniniphila TaxID=75291 RepID=A0ABS9TUR1_9PSEU|nr:hypothetical protein [Pseudonocardia alaniniphila]MCH6172088.1 hypothetical protein [Pseudonocardia alaniniphila]